MGTLGASVLLGVSAVGAGLAAPGAGGDVLAGGGAEVLGREGDDGGAVRGQSCTGGMDVAAHAEWEGEPAQPGDAMLDDDLCAHGSGDACGGDCAERVGAAGAAPVGTDRGDGAGAGRRGEQGVGDRCGGEYVRHSAGVQGEAGDRDADAGCAKGAGGVEVPGGVVLSA